MSLDFGASTNWISRSGAVVSSAPLTVSLWFYPTADQTMNLFTIGDSGANTYWDMEYRGAQNALYWRSRLTPASPVDAVSTAEPTVNAWNHGLGIEISTTSRAIYLNGGNSGSGTDSMDPSAGTLNTTTFGRLPFFNGEHMQGMMAEAGVWGVELNAAEIAALAAGLCPLFVRRQSLVSYVPFASRATDPEPDWITGTGFSHNGTLVAGTSSPRVIRPTAQILQFPPQAAASVGGPLVHGKLVGGNLIGRI